MNLKSTIQDLSKIIERDNKFSTYKFALLRGVTEIVQEKSPFIEVGEEIVRIPLGLLVEKWLLYYYPLLEAEPLIPQIHTGKLAFEAELKSLIRKYKLEGGVSVLYNDLRRGKGVPQGALGEFRKVCDRIANAIVKQPMRYLGGSLNNGAYQVFRCEKVVLKRWGSSTDIHSLLHRYGIFYFKREYYDALDVFGAFFSGEDSLIFKWADFSSRAAKGSIDPGKVLSVITTAPVKERDDKESQALFKEMLNRDGVVKCVWTGKEIRKFEVDHLIPFSVWKNNDLWNLLPSQREVNNRKRDKIPSQERLDKSKWALIEYWKIIWTRYPERFKKELEFSLLGAFEYSEDLWDRVFERLRFVCGELVRERGHDEWS